MNPEPSRTRPSMPMRAIALSLSLFAAAPVAAVEAFWSATPASRWSEQRWRVSLEGESVGDSVEYSPNAEGGGFEPPREKRRYSARAFALDWYPSEDWRFRASVGRRSMTFLRDSYTVDGLGLGLARRLPSPISAVDLELVLDLGSNRTGELYKNSWTEVGESRLTEARMFDVRDDTLMLSVTGRTRLGRSTSAAALVGVGRTRASHARLAGVGTDADGCRYRFETEGGGGELELLERCGSVVSFRETYASAAGIENRLGFSPTADLEYVGRVVQAGATLEHVAGSFTYSASHLYRHSDRGGFDARIREQGGRTVSSSHTTSLAAAFALTPTAALHAGLHYRSTAYLDDLALLYNVFTSDRFVQNAFAFSLGATLSF